MPARTALLISCSKEDARMVRERSKGERRPINSYVLNILMRSVEFQENLYERLERFSLSKDALTTTTFLSPGPRTVFLLRCSVQDARRIRRIAKWRAQTISGFVVTMLRRSWNASESIEMGLRDTVRR